MALHLKLKPRRTLTLVPFRPFSSSSSDATPPHPPPSVPSNDDSGGATAAAAEHETSAAASPPSPSPPSYSLFSDIKERLKSPPQPPRRIPTDPPKPPPISSSDRPPASFEEIRKHLAEFRMKTNQSAAGVRSAATPSISFQELFKNNALNKDAAKAPEEGKFSFDSIREKLRQFRDSTDNQRGSRTRDNKSTFSFDLKSFNDNLRDKIGAKDVSKGPSILNNDKLPDSIFGPELREREERKGESKELKTDFIKMYSYDELGEKLRTLRPEAATKGELSLTELNERLAKLRELEEKETDSRLAGVSFRDLRESLHRLREAETKEANKKAAMQRISIFANLTGQVTPTYMLNPPQEHLLEKYFHPDHMSSAEKMKLELKRVRDEFKMSESDCGSTRVQVAQLTTKIKHLSSALHKKDKHSRKGLQEMVQRRKKLLKYLRKTDWDSYCMVLQKLGLRDVPEYKVPDYKS